MFRIRRIFDTQLAADKRIVDQIQTIMREHFPDLDYHHGNGTQDIFYQRADGLTLSIHGHPNIAYPYFSGFEDETGEGQGLGFNQNFPLGEELDGAAYHKVLQRALRRIIKFRPQFLVVAMREQGDVGTRGRC